MNRIDEIISENIDRYILQETWYDPSTWFQPKANYPMETEEEKRKRIQRQQAYNKRYNATEIYRKEIDNTLELILKGKQDRLLDIGDGKNQAYTLFDTFVSGAQRLLSNYVSNGQVDNSILEYFTPYFPLVKNMIRYVKSNNNPYCRDTNAQNLADEIESSINYIIEFYQSANRILKTNLE